MINKKLLIGIVLIISVAFSIFAAMTFVHAQTDAVVWLEPVDGVDAEVCTNFRIDVMIDVNTPPIADYDFFLSYIASQMTPVNALDGGFLLPLVIFNWEVLPDFYAPGVDAVHVWAVTTDGGNVGSGILATIEFHCDLEGNTPVTLEEIMLSDESGTYYTPNMGNNVVWVRQYMTITTHTYIDPADYTVPICVPFPVHVMVQDVTDLYSYDLVLTYDTAHVDAIDIVDDGFLPPPIVIVNKVIDDPTGTIQFAVSSLAGSGVSGSGSIAKITFHCTGAGESILTLQSVTLVNSLGIQIPTTKAGGRVVQIPYWEPLKLQHLVEWPYVYALVDIPFVPPGSPEGYAEVMTHLTDKGFTFDPAEGTASEVTMFIEDEETHGTVTSWWSSNTLKDGTRACMLSAEMDDGTSMAMGFVTNLLGPEQIPEVDPYIIVNAQPYLFVDFYWWSWYPIGRVVRWPYWWYDSHSHPNWFWGPYYWWRSYTKSYYYPYTDVPYWRPWWGWWWHWTYWRHWRWWSTYFPYDP